MKRSFFTENISYGYPWEFNGLNGSELNVMSWKIYHTAIIIGWGNKVLEGVFICYLETYWITKFNVQSGPSVHLVLLFGIENKNVTEVCFCVGHMFLRIPLTYHNSSEVGDLLNKFLLLE